LYDSIKIESKDDESKDESKDEIDVGSGKSINNVNKNDKKNA
jgi:hypothetical protein